MKKIKKDRTTSIRFPSELLDKAKEHNLDIAEICRQALDKAVKQVDTRPKK